MQCSELWCGKTLHTILGQAESGLVHLKSSVHHLFTVYLFSHLQGINWLLCSRTTPQQIAYICKWSSCLTPCPCFLGAPRGLTVTQRLHTAVGLGHMIGYGDLG